MQPSKRTLLPAPAGTDTTTTVMVSGPDGGPYINWGKGRAWPLLTGERGHYELAAGHDCRPFLHAMEQFSNGTACCRSRFGTKRICRKQHMHCGGPTGSANPLLWAHSEYLRLLRSCQDGKVFDLIPEVAARYAEGNTKSRVEFWLPKHPIRAGKKGSYASHLRAGAVSPSLVERQLENMAG